MSLDPSHQSGRPVPSRKQTVAPISTRHNPLRILICQLFPSATRDTGKGIYYNIFNDGSDNNFDDNPYRTASHTSDNVINFDDYRAHTSSQRLSARDTGSHPSTLRSPGSRRLGSADRMARESLPTERRQSDRLQRLISACVTSPRWAVLSDRFRSDTMGRSISEHQSRSESLRRIRQATLDSLNDYGGWR
jgi:hypothetical protein